MSPVAARREPERRPCPLAGRWVRIQTLVPVPLSGHAVRIAGWADAVGIQPGAPVAVAYLDRMRAAWMHGAGLRGALYGHARGSRAEAGCGVLVHPLEVAGVVDEPCL